MRNAGVVHQALGLLAGVALAALSTSALGEPAMPPMPGMAGHMGHAQPSPAPTPQPAAPVELSPSSPPAAEPAGPDQPVAALADHALMPGMDHAGMGHDAMAGMDHGAMGAMAHMAGALGPYAMIRDASGTAWQPESAPMDGMHGALGGWSTMLHGFATLVQDDQGGPRGDCKSFVESMLMGMAQRPLAGGTLTLRGMGSADPLMGKSGYPLLLQTGETADGRTQLTDRQHPHDLIMELAGAYSRPLGGGLSGFVYLGWPGEPALGPATYMHRFSGLAIPEAPISHHWLDSTHISFGVATAGLVYGGVKLETSRFTGREPNANRYDLDHPRFDSWSVRASWNPTPDWSLQLSHGYLKSPEQLEPVVDQRRTTASATYDRPLAWAGRRGDWQTTFAWGRNDKSPGTSTDAVLLDSAASVGRHTVFGRLERVDKDELFANQPSSPLHDRAFTVGKLSLGYAYTVPLHHHLALDLGGLVSRYALPSALEPAYGDPTSWMLFTRLKIAG